jgi:hypothetical protein
MKALVWYELRVGRAQPRPTECTPSWSLFSRMCAAVRLISLLFMLYSEYHCQNRPNKPGNSTLVRTNPEITCISTGIVIGPAVLYAHYRPRLYYAYAAVLYLDYTVPVLYP